MVMRPGWLSTERYPGSVTSSRLNGGRFGARFFLVQIGYVAGIPALLRRDPLLESGEFPASYRCYR